MIIWEGSLGEAGSLLAKGCFLAGSGRSKGLASEGAEESTLNRINLEGEDVVPEGKRRERRAFLATLASPFMNLDKDQVKREKGRGWCINTMGCFFAPFPST